MFIKTDSLREYIDLTSFLWSHCKMIRLVLLTGFLLGTAVAVPVPAISQGLLTHIQIRQLSERKARIDAVIRDIPEDQFGHRGWTRYISLAGDRRTSLGGSRISTGLRESCVQFAAYSAESGEPIPVSIWILWLGRNIDLVKGESSGVFTMPDYPGLSKMRMWGNKDKDIVVYIDGTYSNTACPK